MKTSVKYLTLALAAIFMAACSSDDDYTPAESQIAVTASDVLFTVEGGTGTVTYEAPGTATATLNSSWCTASVSGNTVTVTAERNPNYEGRTARLVLRYDIDSVVVAVQQTGMNFDNRDVPSVIALGDTAAALSYTLVSSFDVDVETSADWLTATYSDGILSINVAENATGQPREGYVAYGVNGDMDTISVSQFDFDNVYLGKYAAVYYDYDEDDYVKDIITFVNNDGEYSLNFGDFEIPVVVDKENATMTIYNMQPCGTYEGYDLKTGIVAYDARGKIYTPTDETMSITGIFSKEAGFYYVDFKKNSTWKGEYANLEFYDFVVYAFKEGNCVGILFEILNFNFTKL